MLTREGDMQINIERLGLHDVGVDPDTLFVFPKGLSGFEGCHRFKRNNFV